MTTAPCLEHIARLYSSLRVSSVEASWSEESPGDRGLGARVAFLVKNRGAASPDEAPLIEALEYAAMRAGVIPEFVEYEPLEGGSSRAERLSLAIASLASRGRPFVALMPSMLTPALIGRLPQGVLEALEEAAKLNVRVRYENLLYLPRRVEEDSIEIVGKLNSWASYRRVSVLEAKAYEEGIRVKRQVYLDSNREILEYILEAGSRGPLRRVPVTKLALVIAGVYECRYPGKPPINKYIIEEEAEHTIIMVGVPGALAREIEEAVRGVASWAPTIYEAERFAASLAPYVERLVRAIF